MKNTRKMVTASVLIALYLVLGYLTIDLKSSACYLRYHDGTVDGSCNRSDRIISVTDASLWYYIDNNTVDDTDRIKRTCRRTLCEETRISDQSVPDNTYHDNQFAYRINALYRRVLC